MTRDARERAALERTLAPVIDFARRNSVQQRVARAPRIDAQRSGGARRPKTGAELADALEALNLPAGYGDPNIDAPELARRLAARFSRP